MITTGRRDRREGAATAQFLKSGSCLDQFTNAVYNYRQRQVNPTTTGRAHEKMSDTSGGNTTGTAEYEFLRGHIAATMALIHGLIAQGALDRQALDDYFTDYLSRLPHTRETLALRLVIDQWRQGLRDGQDEAQLRRNFLEVIYGGKGRD